jgi:hypothetical protein
MKSLTALWSVLAHEQASRCGTSTTIDISRDIETVVGRTENEGLSFLTITLPTFGKGFQKSLDQGVFAPDTAFKLQRGRCLPAFLQGFTGLVFDPGTGVLLDEPSIDAIFAIRQLTLIFGKIELPCTPVREQDAMDAFVQCEKEVRYADSVLDPEKHSAFFRISQLLFGSLFSVLDQKVYSEQIVPKHGPGSTADSLTSNGKYRLRTWTSRLEDYFHVGDFLFPNARYFNEHYDEISFLEPGEEMPVKVISVPKTQKTPRIIAVEPSAMQYAQQGILEAITKGIDSSYLSQFISTESQEPNQLLAQKGSRDGSLATLDLSEASDRVSNQLIRSMLSNFPHLHGAVDACRSRKADVPGHGVIRLAKFASMGSALCFPFEAMAFLAMVFVGIEEDLGHRFTHKSEFLDFVGRVRIYGDDIIIPVDNVHTVVNSLESFGTRVGTDKSFWIGRFRESCGKEYYDGHDVSIVKVRRLFPTRQQDAPEVISLVSLRNQFYMNGCWGITKWLDERIEKVLPYFPNVLPTSSGLGRITSLGYSKERVCDDYQAPLVKAFVVTSVPPRDPLDGAGALLKFFLKRSSLPAADGRHLERSGRPRAVRIKPRWVSPF